MPPPCRGVMYDFSGLIYGEGVVSPDFSPGRLLLSATYLLSMSYGTIFTMSSLQTALDAFIAPFPLLTTAEPAPLLSQGQALRL